MRALPFLAMGLLSSSAIAGVVVLVLAPEIRAKRKPQLAWQPAMPKGVRRN